jgi:hypothetical protein
MEVTAFGTQFWLSMDYTALYPKRYKYSRIRQISHFWKWYKLLLITNTQKKFSFFYMNWIFQVIRTYEATVNLFPLPFDVHVETIRLEFQTEMTDKLWDTDSRNSFPHIRLLDFYKLYLPTDKFVVFWDHGRRMTSLLEARVCRDSPA